MALPVKWLCHQTFVRNRNRRWVGMRGVKASTILACPLHGDPKGIGTSSSLMFDGHFLCSRTRPRRKDSRIHLHLVLALEELGLLGRMGLNIYRSEKEQQGSEGSENNLGDTVNSPSHPPPPECSVTYQIQPMNYLKESLSAAIRRGEIGELAVMGQSEVPFILPCGLAVPCVLPRGSDSGSERGVEAQAAASPDPVSGWEGAPRHFLVPTGLRRGVRAQPQRTWDWASSSRC